MRIFRGASTNEKLRGILLYLTLKIPIKNMRI